MEPNEKTPVPEVVEKFKRMQLTEELASLTSIDFTFNEDATTSSDLLNPYATFFSIVRDLGNFYVTEGMPEGFQNEVINVKLSEDEVAFCETALSRIKKSGVVDSLEKYEKLNLKNLEIAERNKQDKTYKKAHHVEPEEMEYIPRALDGLMLNENINMIKAAINTLEIYVASNKKSDPDYYKKMN